MEEEPFDKFIAFVHKKSVKVTGSILAIIVLFLLLCVRTVGVGQVGLVTRFGKVVREKQSGVMLKLPFPIESLTKLNVQVQKEQADSEASTSDLQDVHTTLALNYHLDSTRVRTIYTEVGIDYKVRIIDPALQEAFKATSAQFTASELLTKRPEVKEKALQVIKERLNKHDIIVDDLSIVNFQFSGQFTAAIEAKQVAAQQAEQAKYGVEKAKNDAAAAVATAQGQADANIVTATGIARAQQLVQSTVTPATLQKDAIARWDGKMPLSIGNSGLLFNIPAEVK